MYAGEEDAFIYDANNEIVADLDSLSDGCHGDESHPGIQEFRAQRDEVGEYIAKCINEHTDLITALRECRRIAEQEYARTKMPVWGRIIQLCEIAKIDGESE